MILVHPFMYVSMNLTLSKRRVQKNFGSQVVRSFYMPAEQQSELFCPKSGCNKGITLKGQMHTYIFDCPILWPAQQWYNICQ
jgi:hypothetical protein